jgi:hypothetical protein
MMLPARTRNQGAIRVNATPDTRAMDFPIRISTSVLEEATNGMLMLLKRTRQGAMYECNNGYARSMENFPAQIQTSVFQGTNTSSEYVQLALIY